MGPDPELAGLELPLLNDVQARRVDSLSNQTTFMTSVSGSIQFGPLGSGSKSWYNDSVLNSLIWIMILRIRTTGKDKTIYVECGYWISGVVWVQVEKSRTRKTGEEKKKYHVMHVFKILFRIYIFFEGGGSSQLVFHISTNKYSWRIWSHSVVIVPSGCKCSGWARWCPWGVAGSRRRCCPWCRAPAPRTRACPSAALGPPPSHR